MRRRLARKSPTLSSVGVYMNKIAPNDLRQHLTLHQGKVTTAQEMHDEIEDYCDAMEDYNKDDGGAAANFEGTVTNTAGGNARPTTCTNNADWRQCPASTTGDNVWRQWPAGNAHTRRQPAPMTGANRRRRTAATNRHRPRLARRANGKYL